MEDEDIVLIDGSGNIAEHVGIEESIPDDREGTFKRIIKDSGTRVNVDNLTRAFFSGDVEDRERLVKVLKKAQISPAKVETIYSVWFDGSYPEDDGISLYTKAVKKGDNIADDEYDTDKLIKDMSNQELIAQKKRIMTLQAKKLEIEMRKEIKDLDEPGKDAATTERIEPVMTVDEGGNIEIAKDDKGVPITRRIVEPVSAGGGGSSMTELIMMQSMLGNKNSGDGNTGMLEIKIQGLEAELGRMRDKIESDKERAADRISEKDARIESIKDKMVEDLIRMKEDRDRDVNAIKDKAVEELARLRGDKDKEISVMRERYEDKINNIENRNLDAISALEDRYAIREERVSDKMSRVESDAMDSINGIQARHHEELSRLHTDYKNQIMHFIERADDNLSSAQTTFSQDLKHRDDMSGIKEQNDIRLKALEQEMKDREIMSDTERQNSQIINAVGSGVEKAIDTFGKPMAAGMVTQNAITQQTLEDQSINKKLALIDDMRRGGYSEKDIEFVVDKNAQPPQASHDAAYEKILMDDRDQGVMSLGSEMVRVDEYMGGQSAENVIDYPQAAIPQTTYDQPGAGTMMKMRTSG